MFKVGEYVVYGNKGVCQIKSVGPIDMPGVPKDREYYTMSQVYLRGSTIFTPVDNETKALRKVLTKKQAKQLIEDFKNIEPNWITDDKERDRIFTEILRGADCKELSNMLVSLHHRKEERIAGGKKATSTDERFFHAAEDILLGELGIALGVDREKVREYIIESVS